MIVLLVEDEFLIRCSLADRLREEGCVVIEAASAEYAIAVCRTGTPVHILITDIQLDGRANGWDVAEAFRAFWQDIPVIYTSGNASDRTRAVPNSLFFNKPCQPDELLGACQQLTASH